MECRAPEVICIKDLVSNYMMLACYDSKKKKTLRCDFSENGLGVTILVSYMAFKSYLCRFTVECDHKTLSQISQKNMSLALPRLRGMLRSIADYHFVIRHRPGKELVHPDAFSRLSQFGKSKVEGTALIIKSIIDMSVLGPE